LQSAVSIRQPNMSTSSSTTTNADLARERASASFSPERITNFLDRGSPSSTARRREIESAVIADPSGIFDQTDDAYASRTELHVRALGRMVRMVELQRKLRVTEEEYEWIVDAVGEDLPTALHWIMFVPNIRTLCDEEQQKYWLDRALNYEAIGCYAQTELGHGSNVRALETTATYDCATDEFVVNSPTLTSKKFWPGTLGRTANVAMVIARLIDGGGVDRGVHNFIVPLRCPHSHRPLPGVEVGDVGPKIGYNKMDNGFCSFDNVRIPRFNMAARFAKIIPGTGEFVAKEVSEAAKRINYVTMMYVRSQIIYESGKNLARGCTIAIRYACVRRQGFVSESSDEERQVIDYVSLQHTLLPLLAAAYAYRMVGKRVLLRLKETEAALLLPDTAVTKEQISDLHSSTSCLKSVCSKLASDGLEKARKCCGGHGFLVSSGLPELIGTYLQNPTVEGDNAMLHQQTVRVLLKILPTAAQLAKNGQANTGSAGPWEGTDCEYLVRGAAQILSEVAARAPAPPLNIGSPADLLDLQVLCAAHRRRASHLLLGVAKELRDAAGNGEEGADSWNGALVQMARASTAHATALILDNFRDIVDHPNDCLGPKEAAALRRLAVLLGVHGLETDLADFLEGGQVRPADTGKVRTAVKVALHAVRPDAVPLVDAWDFSDFRLKSALGRFDGDVYPAIIAACRREPLNATEPGPGYAEHLGAFIADGRRKRQQKEGGVVGTASRL